MNIHCPAFLGGARHGGVRRSEQILALLADAFGPERVCTAAPPGDFGALLRRRLAGSPTRFARALLESRHWEKGAVDRVRWALSSIHYAEALGTPREATAWIEYSSSYSRYAPRVASNLGIPYVLFPQNIEFLVRGRVSRIPGGEFEREIDAIREAELVVCICDQDAAICETFNERVAVVPYHPGPADLDSFACIRRRRAQSPKRRYLALGSAVNPSTHPGFREVVELLRSSGIDREEILVVGYGTETLRGVLGDGAVVLGSVESQNLEDLLSSCCGVVVHQRQTSGFLTRLVELNLSGVPVLVAGGYRQAAGLEEYGVFRGVEAFLAEVPQGPFRSFEAPSSAVIAAFTPRRAAART